MLDNNNSHKIKSILKIVLVTAAILIGILIFLVIDKNNKAVKILKKEGYTQNTNKIYTKQTDTVNYIYDIDSTKFSKAYTITTNDTQEEFSFSFNNNIVNIIYDYTDLKGCHIMQTGIYSKDDYKCTIKQNRNNCESKCDNALKEVKKFYEEATKFVDKLK